MTLTRSASEGAGYPRLRFGLVCPECGTRNRTLPRLSQPRSGDIVKPGGVRPRFFIPQNDSQAPEGRHRPPVLTSRKIVGLLADGAPAGAQENTPSL